MNNRANHQSSQTHTHHRSRTPTSPTNPTSPTSHTISTLLTLLLITALAITAIHPAAAAGPTTTGVSAVPAELNITKATDTLNAAIAEGNWPRATAYAELITMNDGNAPATVWCKWGYALRKMGRYDDAVEKVTTAIEKDPDNAMSYINRGYASLALGRYHTARMDAEEALRLEQEGATTTTTTTTTTATSTDCAAAGDDTAASAYNIIALGLLGEGDAKNALVAADTALALRPDHAHYLNTKGMIQMELEKYGDAVTTLTRAVELQDTYTAPYPDAPTPEENLATAQRLYDENKAPVGLIIAAAVLILVIGAGAIFLQKRR